MKIIWALVVFLFVGLHSAKAQPQTKAPDGEIVLDEVEFVVKEGDRIKESKPMRERDAHDLAREMRKKGLPANQTIFSKRMDHPRLRFVDWRGKTKKEIILGTETRISTGSIRGSTEVRAIESLTTRRADLSHYKSHAVIWEYHGEPFEPGDGRASGSLVFLNAEGDVIWEKQLHRFMIPGTCKVSADGSRIVTIQAWTKFQHLDPAEPLEQLVVYDAQGAEILRHPTSKDISYERLHAGTDDLIISPNGKYAAIRARRNKKEIVVFLDLTKGTHWDMAMAAAPIDISNEGIARVGRLTGAKIETVNLREKL